VTSIAAAACFPATRARYRCRVCGETEEVAGPVFEVVERRSDMVTLRVSDVPLPLGLFAHMVREHTAEYLGLGTEILELA
jgi:hypothetical protein